MKVNSFHLLVDSEEFMNDLEHRILKAKNRVLIQAMTFEADKAGMRLYGALKESLATKKILCVDAYSLVNINDGWAFGARYLTNTDHRSEVNSTREILKSSGEFGVKVVITNPIGFFGEKYPFRNHKKLMIVDEVAYLGGINFSNHNFAWHDFMIRISDSMVVEALAKDFRITCQNKNQSGTNTTDSGRLYFMNGASSSQQYGQLFDEILKAKRSVTILSPYVSDPLLTKLSELNTSVKISIVTPRENNKSLMKNALYGRIRKSNFKLYEYSGRMSHLKAILVDDTKLVFGSSNFDIVSYHLEQEVVMVSEDENLIAQFKERILNPDIENSQVVDLKSLNTYWAAQLAMFLLKRVVAVLAFFRPAQSWDLKDKK